MVLRVNDEWLNGKRVRAPERETDRERERERERTQAIMFRQAAAGRRALLPPPPPLDVPLVTH